jgi:hypothetical protein
MNLVFLHGPAAAGKLTVGRELSRITGYRLFHNHLVVDLLNAVFDFGSDSFIRLREEMWLSVFREAALRDVSLIFTFTPERTVRESFVADAIGAVQGNGGRILFVELTCPESVLDQRVEDASRAPFGKLRSKSMVHDLRASGVFDYPKLPSDLMLDTGSLSPQEAAGRIQIALSRS